MSLNMRKIEEDILPEQFQDCKLPGENQIATVWLHGTALKNKVKLKGEENKSYSMDEVDVNVCHFHVIPF